MRQEIEGLDVRKESEPIDKVVVDHVGFRVTSEEEYDAVRNALFALGLGSNESPAEGHRRTFFDLGEVRFEVQLWDTPEMRRPGVHLDVRSSNPMGVLNRLGDNAQDWGEGEVPRGGILITPLFMVMARQTAK